MLQVDTPWSARPCEARFGCEAVNLTSHLVVSWNRATPKSSILLGFSIIKHLFWGYPHWWKLPFVVWTRRLAKCQRIVLQEMEAWRVMACRTGKVENVEASRSPIHWVDGTTHSTMERKRSVDCLWMLMLTYVDFPLLQVQLPCYLFLSVSSFPLLSPYAQLLRSILACQLQTPGAVGSHSWFCWVGNKNSTSFQHQHRE